MLDLTLWVDGGGGDLVGFEEVGLNGDWERNERA